MSFSEVLFFVVGFASGAVFGAALVVVYAMRDSR